VEVSRFSRTGLGALSPDWQQTHTRMQFSEVDLSALWPHSLVQLLVEGRSLWKSHDSDGLGLGSLAQTGS
jgi:hypothetical protein